MSTTSDVIEYTDCIVNQNITYGHAPPVYYQCPDDNKTYIIISTTYSQKYVYLYDISSNHYIQKYKYPDHFTPKHHGAILHKKANQLYLIGGSSMIFAVLDLKSHEWMIHNSGQYLAKKKYDNVECYDLIYPYVIDNKIHILHHERHIIFDINQDKFITTACIHGPENSGRRCGLITKPTPKLLIYGGEYRDWLYIFGDDDDDEIDGSFYSKSINHQR